MYLFNFCGVTLIQSVKSLKSLLLFLNSITCEGVMPKHNADIQQHIEVIVLSGSLESLPGCQSFLLSG